MRISDLLRFSVDNLRRRKGRTALTVVGVVVGTCAIVVMISLGIAMNAQNEQMLQSWGDLTQITLYNYSGNANSDTALDDALVERIERREYVVGVSPYYSPQNLNVQLYAGKNNRYRGYVNIYGLNTDTMEKMGFSLDRGSWLSEDNANPGKNRIAVLAGNGMGYQFQDTRRREGSTSRYRWQGQTDVNGNELPPFVDIDKDKMTLSLLNSEGKVAESYQLVVVGVMATDYNKGWFTEGGIVMRVEDVKKLEAASVKINRSKKADKTTYEQIAIKVDDVNHVAEVENWLKEEGYQPQSMTQIREEMQQSVAKSQLILGGLAAVSLLVAALNIANTMTMAIYERTREIGVMKVLGCGLGYIRAMFLMESGAIGFLGGVVGVAVSFVISTVLNHIGEIAAFFGSSVDLSGLMSSMGGMGGGGEISIIPLWLVLLALGFATLVGLLSGIAPAGRAVKISSLEAIRHN